ncbi:hypothetical protein AX17_001671 [Amanita inopinata Kibby_2008]|nr:hypothetical protein AX17_001671 [Amanita inopinata Kibby_2008]
MPPPPRLLPVNYSHQEDLSFLASNAFTRPPGATHPISVTSTTFMKPSDRTPVPGKHYPTHFVAPSQGVKLLATPNDIRSRTKRAFRISSFHHRVYYDQHQSPSFPISSIPPPPLKDLALPPFPTPIVASGSASKLRPHHRWSWRPLFVALYDSPPLWLALYFLLNLTLTLYNKSVLIKFPFPYSLTALHTLCSAVGSSVLLRSYAVITPSANQSHPRLALNWRETVALIAFSILFTVNIVISNVSLDLVTVPFHQVMRASTPFFTILLSKILLGSRTSRSKLTSLIPVVAGVAFATYGDCYFSLWGFFLTLLGTVLAALKTIVTNVLQSPSTSENSTLSKEALTPFTSFFRALQPRPTLQQLSPLEHLHLLSPLAFLQSLILAHMNGELTRMYYYTLNHLSYIQRLFLIMNGILAFGLNVTSFGANKRVGAVAMSVAANVKQVLTMLCAVTIFDLNISPTNGIGIILTLGGGAWYTAVELQEKKRAEFIRQSTSDDEKTRMDTLRVNMEKGQGCNMLA